MSPVRVQTDAGEAFVKALGNPEGPHALACEWVGVHLASWLGLTVPAFAIIQIDDEVDIRLARGGTAATGPAYATRAVGGDQWSGEAADFTVEKNGADLARLVVFDTWTLNPDRHAPGTAGRAPHPDNVHIVPSDDEPQRRRRRRPEVRIVSIDHGHCFRVHGELGRGLYSIDRARSDDVYGLFPGWERLVPQREVRRAARRLVTLERPWVRELVASVPTEWEVGQSARTALVQLLCERAAYVAAKIEDLLRPMCRWQEEFPFMAEAEG